MMKNAENMSKCCQKQIITAKELEQDMNAIFDRIDAEEIFIKNESRFYKIMLVESKKNHQAHDKHNFLLP